MRGEINLADLCGIACAEQWQRTRQRKQKHRRRAKISSQAYLLRAWNCVSDTEGTILSNDRWPQRRGACCCGRVVGAFRNMLLTQISLHPPPPRLHKRII